MPRFRVDLMEGSLYRFTIEAADEKQAREAVMRRVVEYTRREHLIDGFPHRQITKVTQQEG